MAVFEYFGETDRAETLGDPFRRNAGVVLPNVEESGHEYRSASDIRRRHIDAKLEAAPNGAIKKLGVIGRRDCDDIARQLIELHQEERDDPLNLARLVHVAALFADGVELVEE